VQDLQLIGAENEEMWRSFFETVSCYVRDSFIEHGTSMLEYTRERGTQVTIAGVAAGSRERRQAQGPENARVRT